MSDNTDRMYYQRRAEQEDACGDRASDPVIAAIHFELASAIGCWPRTSPR